MTESSASSWWALLVSAIALFVAMATFWSNRRTRVERSAEGVSARAKIREVDDRPGEAALYGVVNNSGPIPIHDVVVSVYLRTREKRFIGTCDVVPAGTAVQAELVRIDGCDATGIGTGNPIEVEFRDGNGRIWKRPPSGRLTQIGVGERYRRWRFVRLHTPSGYLDELRPYGICVVPREKDGTKWFCTEDYLGREVEFVTLRDCE
jgi:hypothetical protein